MVTTKGFLQLYNLTYNGTLEVNDGSVVFIDEVNIGVTIDEDGEDDVYPKFCSFCGCEIHIWY